MNRKAFVIIMIAMLFAVSTTQAFNTGSSPFSPGNSAPPSEATFGQIGAYQTSGGIVSPFSEPPTNGGPGDGGIGGGIDPPTQNDLPMGNGLWLLLAIAGLHTLFLWFRRRVIQ